jgi:mRNA-degrading endonuclease RelE of RelBE toxin-antitoxin system
MILEIIFSHQAKKFIQKNSNHFTAEMIADAVELAMRKILLREDNTADVISMKGRKGYWRVRIGGIRAIFRYEGRELVIVNIEKIEHRGNVY